MAEILKTPKPVAVATKWQIDTILIEPEYRGVGRCIATYSVRDTAGNILAAGEADFQVGMKAYGDVVAAVKSVVAAKLKGDGLE